MTDVFRRLFHLVWGGDVDRALRPVLAVQLAGSIAGSTCFPFLGIWAIKELGASQGALGTALLIGAVTAAFSSYLGGHLSDHLGRRPLILTGWTLTAGFPLLFLAVGHHVLAGLALLGFFPAGESIGGAVAHARVAALVPPERQEAGYAAVRVASNFGVTIGPPLGGLLLYVGSWQALFLGCAFLALNASITAFRFIPRRGAYAPERPPERSSLGA